MKMLRFVALVIATLPCMKQAAASYDEARNAFKEQLYGRQIGLMDREMYFKFIEPHLQEAEKSLKLAQYYKNHPNATSIENYFGLLADTNVASFHYYVAPKGRAEGRLVTCKSELTMFIQKVKEAHKLNDMDVREESDKTFKILSQANESYYKKLSLTNKFFLWLVS